MILPFSVSFLISTRLIFINIDPENTKICVVQDPKDLLFIKDKSTENSLLRNK